MGKEIEQAALSKDHQIIEKIDIENYDKLNASLAKEADVAIEFTQPSHAVKNILRCFSLDLPVVCGTTGWHDQLDSVAKECMAKNQSLFHASNFSLGVNLFFALNEKMAELMNAFPSYNPEMVETHHTKKLDAPSGTAVSLAEIIIGKLDRKNDWKLGEGGSGDIKIQAKREGDVFGIHSIKYDSETDYIEMTHFAKNRKGFASGALLAAEFIHNRKGVYTMRDLLGI